MPGVVTDGLSLKAGLQDDSISRAIAGKIGQQKYRIWFESTTRLIICEDYLKIAVPNLFIANWIENHFLNEIKQALKDVTGQDIKITFVVDCSVGGAQRSTGLDGRTKHLSGLIDGKPSANRQVQTREKPHPRRQKMTLENFVVGPSNQLAFNAAGAVVNDDRVSFNPLFIHGGYGVGKTHLLQGICNAAHRKNPTTRWLYLSAEDFVNQFVLALKTKKLEAFRGRIRQVDLLAIDDIHFFANKPSSQEEFLYTFNSIDMAGKQIVLASDAHPKMIKQLSEKLIGRFVSGMVVKIDQPDLQTRCEICRQFAARRQVSLPDSVVKFIAENLRSNVRELEGASLKVIAYSALQNQKISLELAKEILAEHLSRTDPIVHISDIDSAVAAFFGTTAAELHSSRKDRTVALARHFSMYLARKHTKMSSTEVGKFMGNKNHATVLLACKKVDEQIEKNAELHWFGPNGNRVAKAKVILAGIENAIAY